MWKHIIPSVALGGLSGITTFVTVVIVLCLSPKPQTAPTQEAYSVPPRVTLAVLGDAVRITVVNDNPADWDFLVMCADTPARQERVKARGSWEQTFPRDGFNCSVRGVGR